MPALRMAQAEFTTELDRTDGESIRIFGEVHVHAPHEQSRRWSEDRQPEHFDIERVSAVTVFVMDVIGPGGEVEVQCQHLAIVGSVVCTKPCTSPCTSSR